jgi:CYTH domain-containing protein
MPKEIERKFLVKDDSYKKLGKPQHIHQGFLNTERERVVRVRLMDEKAWITIKGLSIGATRQEFEYEIPSVDAKYMIENLCEKPTLEKYRYVIPYEGFTWEVDEFLGDNAGLLVAEIELESEAQTFPLPAWVGEEVTGDDRYYNANLIKNPFKNW